MNANCAVGAALANPNPESEIEGSREAQGGEGLSKGLAKEVSLRRRFRRRRSRRRESCRKVCRKRISQKGACPAEGRGSCGRDRAETLPSPRALRLEACME